MNINRDNYEQFFIDYYDESLNKSQIDELFLFLEANIDAREEFFAYSPELSLISENVIFENKNQLKQITNETIIEKNNFEQFCVAKIEGDLSKQQQIDFEQFVNTKNEYSEHYDLYKKTILKADLNIVYNRKYALKHFVINKEKSNLKIKPFYWLVSAVAASILLFFMLKINNSETEKGISNNTNNIKFLNLDSALNQIKINNQIAENKSINKIEKIETPRKNEKIKKLASINYFSEKTEIQTKSLDLVAVETVFVPKKCSDENIVDNVEFTQLNTKPTVKKNEPQTLWNLAQKGLVKFLKNNKLPIKTTFDNNNHLDEIALNTKFLSVEHVFDKK